MQGVEELVRQHRVAARQAVPVGGIDPGQIIEHARVEFGQRQNSLVLAQQQYDSSVE
jgi:hypothetical protein